MGTGDTEEPLKAAGAEPTYSRLACRNCNGTGEIAFTPERGGPRCPACGGHGHLTYEVFLRSVGAVFDHPSVYMGGASRQGIHKAESVAGVLAGFGLVLPTSNEAKPSGSPIPLS